MPKKPAVPSSKLEKLKSLSDDFSEQQKYALEIVKSEHNRQLIEAALQVLEKNLSSDLPLRASLLPAYEYYAKAGPKSDEGGHIRTKILKLLQDFLLPDDEPLLERAVNTYEFDPFSRAELLSALRAEALIGLNSLDDRLAIYHAVRLLHDKYNSPMSGQPGIAAAQVLASINQFVCLYQYVVREEVKSPEVTAECLRQLIHLPLSLVEGLIEQYRNSQNDIVLVGLFDLLLNHDSAENFTSVITEFMMATKHDEVYSYIALTIIARHNKKLIDILLQVGAIERNKLKARILVEALSLSPKLDASAEAIIKRLKALVTAKD